MVATVIIPARNEAQTIGAIVKTFNTHPGTSGRVYVFVDAATTDETAAEVWDNGGTPIHVDKHGKGQVVYAGVHFLSIRDILTHRIILCDGDYTGLTHRHIDLLLKAKGVMAVGVPEYPEKVPDHVTKSWPLVSGFRCLPWYLVPEDAHGYLLETQINMAAAHEGIGMTQIMMFGLKSPFAWPLDKRRHAAMMLDRQWGRIHGILER